MPNTLLFAALVAIPSLLAYALSMLGLWLGGRAGMRIGTTFAATLVSVPLLAVALFYLRLLLEGGSLTPRYGDQLLGLILSALIAIGTLAALVTLKLAWNRQSKVLHPIDEA